MPFVRWAVPVPGTGDRRTLGHVIVRHGRGRVCIIVHRRAGVRRVRRERAGREGDGGGAFDAGRVVRVGWELGMQRPTGQQATTYPEIFPCRGATSSRRSTYRRLRRRSTSNPCPSRCCSCPSHRSRPSCWCSLVLTAQCFHPSSNMSEICASASISLHGILIYSVREFYVVLFCLTLMFFNVATKMVNAGSYASDPTGRYITQRTGDFWNWNLFSHWSRWACMSRAKTRPNIDQENWRRRRFRR